LKAVVCVAGGMGAGKSTLARKLADRFPGSTVRAFGDVVRARAAADGLAQDRATLQELGLRLVAEGWPAFVDELLEDFEVQDEGLLVVEGIRHAAAVKEVRRHFPDIPVLLAYLKLNEMSADERLRERDGVVGGRDHVVESEVEQLEEMADMVLDAAQAVAASVEAIRTRLP
jgi:dephospho-CoA kinase